jgi:hypothetical protein
LLHPEGKGISALQGFVNRPVVARILGRKEHLLLAACLLLALGLRVWGLDFGLPHRYHVDEPPGVLAALEIGRGNLDIAYPNMSPHLYQFLLLGLFGGLFLVYLATGRAGSAQDFARQYQVDPTAFYLLARGLSVVASLLAILLVYRLGRRLADRRTGLMAALALSVCFLDVQNAHFARSYPIVALCAVAVVLLSVSYLRYGRLGHLLLAGLLAGVAGGFRFPVAVLGLVPFLSALFRVGQEGEERSIPGRLGLLVVAGVLGFLVACPAFVLFPRRTLAGFGLYAQLATDSAGFQGFQFFDGSSLQFYAGMVSMAFGVPLSLMAALGVVRSIWRHHPEDMLLLAFPLTYGAILLAASARSSAFARFLVPVLPFLALFAADGTLAVVDWATRRRGRGTRGTVLVAVVGLLVAIPAARAVQLDRLWGRTDTRTLAKEWIEANIPEGARVASQWHGPPLATASDPEPNSQRVYDVEIVDPFSSDVALYSVEAYRDKGFEYVILSSFIYELERVDRDENDARALFYAALAREGELVAEFGPYAEGEEGRFLFEEMWGPITTLWQRERPGPTVKIYRVGP